MPVTESTKAALAVGLVLGAGVSGGLAWWATHRFPAAEKPSSDSIANGNTQRRNLIDEYRRADFGDPQNFPVLDDSYRNRIALEFEIIRSGQIEPLREAMRDSNRYVRAFSVTGLGILGDHASQDAIADMAADPETDRMVGGAAVQSLGWLKGGLDAIRSARANSRKIYPHLLDITERQIQDSTDHAAKVREAYQMGLRQEDIGSAKVGMLAPDFTSIDTDGSPFKL